MKMRVKEVFAWAFERHQIHLRRSKGLPKPWTKDPILQRYRFCEVYRELDKVTQWITREWREPYRLDPNIWFAMAVARLVNWPETLRELGLPLPWNAKHFEQTLNDRKKRGDKVFTGAYMIHCGYAGSSKAAYLAKEVLTPLWEDRDRINMCIDAKKHFTLEAFHKLLMTYQDLGTFMAAQIIADAKYTPRFKKAPDWATFAAMGPGSSRGMNRVLGIPLQEIRNGRNKENFVLRGTLPEKEWQLNLAELRKRLLPLFKEAKMPTPHAQDVQSILCEYDKFERVRLNEGSGRPRSNYPGI